MDTLTQEHTIKGLKGSEGIVIGSLLVVDEKKKKVQPRKIKSSSIISHLERFVKAKKQFLEELDELSLNLDKKTASILETQRQIISDEEIEKRINTIIEVDLLSVEYAIYKTFCDFIERLRESGSELFKQRIIDLENLRDRLIVLSCKDNRDIQVEKGTILVIKEISPTDLVAYHEQGVAGLVMEKGGVTSHAALIAQSLGIPCIVSAKMAVSESTPAKKGILDADSGALLLNPSKNLVSDYKKKIRQINRSKKNLQDKGERCETKDGFPFHLRANIEFEQELKLANEYAAEGVGLLRTEALLYGGMAKKSEPEQDKFYEAILAGTSGPVTIRLFDVGGDKLNTHTPQEDNPFLGWRGIRMLLDEKSMFFGQLRSILKNAGRYPGRVKILVPMISTLEEVVVVRETVEEVQKQLLGKGLPIDEDVPLGIMIEVPSAALLARHFAKEVDFFSIGTNDLTQYTLAVDRGNEQICSLYKHHHPAVWQLIKLTVEAARECEVELSVCGELAGDVLGASVLMGLGVNDLSMSPVLLPKVKRQIMRHTRKELEELSAAVLECSTTEQIENLYRNLN